MTRGDYLIYSSHAREFMGKKRSERISYLNIMLAFQRIYKLGFAYSITPTSVNIFHNKHGEDVTQFTKVSIPTGASHKEACIAAIGKFTKIEKITIIF